MLTVVDVTVDEGVCEVVVYAELEHARIYQRCTHTVVDGTTDDVDCVVEELVVW